MLSIENLYWILFENLLDPVGIDCWYYYPFGTQNNLSRSEEFRPWSRYHHHVLFHFDQEPLQAGDNLGKLYDELPGAWNGRIFRTLANSEHSAMKKEVCAKRQMSDWYFFYHAFAALDWFRDTQYVSESQKISRLFCSFNHLVTGKRAYRMALTATLIDRDLQQKGDISFHASAQDCTIEINDRCSSLSDRSRETIYKNLCVKSQLPLLLGPGLNHYGLPIDTRLPGSHFSAQLGHHEYKLWQRSLWHIVNETVFYDPKLHLTEKIFKPIVAQRPFMLVAAPGNLAYLRSYGFKTFDRWIDESYDQIQDPDARLDAIAVEIGRLAHMDLKALEDMHQDMLPILEFNKQHFFGQFREIIVDELINNFDTCVRSWNNGRVDGRELAVPRDLESVKKVLLR